MGNRRPEEGNEPSHEDWVMQGGWKKDGIPTLDTREKHKGIMTTTTLEEEEVIGAVTILGIAITKLIEVVIEGAEEKKKQEKLAGIDTRELFYSFH
ncbi:hypothetical protein MA16_Dca002093 [Dendrobium catenatum]|uniref:Uncharacterized protein n=1 Tax=Dendrobium catenatum TaxID=906689 RepID=A0A2I0XEC6_9ASPA|nr:hypothetical protein MA16_Dca002093 [Dendrobium catenatum]